MAERRMFAKTIVDSDAFLDMPLSTQVLYFHLNMRADDDGFINNPKRVQRMIGCSDDDMKILIAKNFIFVFNSGVVVIKDWKIHNYIRQDRYKDTIHQDELKQLKTLENKSYYLGLPDDNQWSTQERIGKNSIEEGKERKEIGEDSVEIICPAPQNDPLPYAEIINYLNEKTGAHYKSTTNKTQSQIKARFNEGFTLEDFKTVIDKKVNEWHGTKMQKYLRPETLFGTKFEGYLNQEECMTFKDVSNMINWEDEYDE